MVFVAVIGWSEWMRIPDQRVENPYRCLHPRFFLLRLKHLEESAVCGRDVYIFWYLFSLIISLHFYTASHCTTVQIILIRTLLVITLKYHSAFHEQAWLCHLFSYRHNLPIKLQLSSTPQRHQKGLGLLVRERGISVVLYFLVNLYQQFSVLKSPGFIFSLSGCLLLFLILVSPPYSTGLCLQHLPFPFRRRQQWLLDECVCLPHCSIWRPTSTHITHVKTPKHGASEGSGKVRYSDEVWSKNTSCFPGKAASEKVPVCALTT